MLKSMYIQTNISNLHSCFDVNTSFVICYTIFEAQYRKLVTISAFFLTHSGQILVQTGVVSVLVLLQGMVELFHNQMLTENFYLQVI
jgi:hypothetical protein